MKLKYKYVHFIKTDEIYAGKNVWECRNNKNKHILAKIYWYNRWKQYVFTQYAPNVIFNDSCLSDTVSFLKELDSQ